MRPTRPLRLFFGKAADFVGRYKNLSLVHVSRTGWHIGKTSIFCTEEGAAKTGYRKGQLVGRIGLKN
jgi:hypothetical protein